MVRAIFEIQFKTLNNRIVIRLQVYQAIQPTHTSLKMSSGWRGALEKIRSFAGGGLDRGSNIASWALAGGVAYYLWVKPSKDLEKQHQVISILPLFEFCFSFFNF